MIYIVVHSYEFISASPARVKLCFKLNVIFKGDDEKCIETEKPHLFLQAIPIKLSIS